MTPLIVGAVLAVIALVFVLHPLFDDSARPSRTPKKLTVDTPAVEAVQALREIEFDRETGKLSDSDYGTLKTRYTREAVAAFREEESEISGDAGDAAEAVILRYRKRQLGCAECGPRPEPDAVYCSNCGRYLAASCAKCHAPVTEIGARFCRSCGESLAA
ncbi:MAG TPA: zinc ribbon domain-containing protein [Gemmatimonadaceae bacterium]|nr:zinc ribbon domain-containing protein [Gemmatimonadaceae bacterium]